MLREDWFPGTEPEQIVVVQNLKDKLASYQEALGMSVAEFTAALLLLETFLEVVQKNIEVQAAAVSFTSFKNFIKDGPEGDPAPDAPPFPPMILPAGATAGIVKQLRKLRNGWLLQPGYTPEIGSNLMIIGTATPEPPPSEMQATLKLAQVGDYTTAFTFSRQGMDAVRVEWRLAGTETWHLGGDFTSSPANIVLAPSTPNQPFSTEFRGRLMRRNQPVGIWSPLYTAFVTP